MDPIAVFFSLVCVGWLIFYVISICVDEDDYKDQAEKKTRQQELKFAYRFAKQFEISDDDAVTIMNARDGAFPVILFTHKLAKYKDNRKGWRKAWEEYVARYIENL
jgi:hypothetical protein